MTKVYVVTSIDRNYEEDDKLNVEGVFSTREDADRLGSFLGGIVHEREIDPPLPAEYDYWECKIRIDTGVISDERTYKAFEKMSSGGAARGHGIFAIAISKTSADHARTIAKAWFRDVNQGMKHPSLTYCYD